ncbi:uncharacterized protein C8A04DRAFT_28108 [Dichotomopilus funicola]|uniref:Uncharacterized protein n=1 Tax=Dichotomopilus funicola TaxID=1934379 RepID=A0AAN6V4E7_9PEZI|nr:hypothetical protein C8A04DRAFT_28108 [Dichotomopilus funicola]
MLFSSLLAIPALLATAAVAAPAFEIPEALAPRVEACPTVTRYKGWDYSTTWLATTTVTNGWSSLGSVTSTKTEHETRTINTRTTVYSPLVTTLPATTTTVLVTSGTLTINWFTETTTVTSAGYAPPSACQVTTVTSSIPTVTSTTVTMDLLYDTTWASTVGHVTTTTFVTLKTVSHTDTAAGSTAYSTTITQPVTVSSVWITTATETSTVWEKGCKSWACQA